MITTLAQYEGKGLWLPDQASTFAPDMDWLFLFIVWVSVFFTVIIMGVLVWCIAAYRMKRGDDGKVSHGVHHNNTLEITWSVIPLILVLVIFLWGFRGYLDMTTAPTGSYNIYVDAKKWNWMFQYPEGKTSPVLVVPAGRPILLTLNSQDVIHSFWVPAWRNKKDAVPGRYNQLWVEPIWDASRATEVKFTPPGLEESTTNTFTLPDGMKGIMYDLYCTEYCGTKHSWMRTAAVVLQEEDFQKWITFDDSGKYPPIVNGNRLYLQQGCNACHSADGTPGTGPSFRNLFGKQENTSAGPVTADREYIAESIRYPGRKIVQGYAGQMPAYNLSDTQIDYITAWLMSISENVKQTPEEINAQFGWTGEGEGTGSMNPNDRKGEDTDALPGQQPPTAAEGVATPAQQQEEQTGRSEQGVQPSN